MDINILYQKHYELLKKLGQANQAREMISRELNKIGEEINKNEPKVKTEGKDNQAQAEKVSEANPPQ